MYTMPCFLDSYLIIKYTSILLECIVLWRGLLFIELPVFILKLIKIRYAMSLNDFIYKTSLLICGG